MTDTEKWNNSKNLYPMLREISDSIPDLLWAKDLERRFTFVNKATCEILLKAENTEEAIGKTGLYFAEKARRNHKGDKDWYTFGEICEDSDLIVMNSCKPGRFDEFGNVEGKFLYLEVHKVPFFNEKGELIGTVGSARDVTRQKELERENRRILDQLAASEQKYRSMLTKMPGAFILCEIVRDRSGEAVDLIIKETNFTFDKMIGRSNNELIGSSLLDIHPLVDMDNIRKLLNVVVKGKSFRVERYFAEVDKYLEILAYSSSETYVALIITDITERKQVENALKKSEERLELALAGSDLGIWEWWIQTGEAHYNSKWAGILGYSLEELYPFSIETWSLNTHQEDKTEADRQLKLYLSGERETYECEMRMKHKNGNWVWIHSRGKVFEWDKNGKPLRMAGTHRNITEKKIIENQMTGLTNFFENLCSDPLVNINRILESTCKLLGGVCSLYNKLDDEENSLILWNSFNAPDDIEKRDEPEGHICYQATIKGKNRIIAIGNLNRTEYYETDPNVKKYGLKSYLGAPVIIDNKTRGSLCIVDTSERNFTSMEKHIISTLAKALSVEEERIRNRRELWENESKYRSYFENSPLSLWEQDYSDIMAYIDTLPISNAEELRTYFDTRPEEVIKCIKMVKIKDVNPASIRMYEADSKEDLLKGIGSLFTKEAFDIFKEELVCFYNKERFFSSETTGKTFKGKVIKTKLDMSMLSDFRVLVTITDITESKNKELELRELLSQTQSDAITKGILLREINHRIKNNLSSFIGMLYAERKRSKSKNKEMQRELVNNLINRIKGISIAHEMLSSSQWSPIPISTLTERIIHSLKYLIPKDRKISTKINSSEIMLDADQTHSIAIIVNELFTNSIEYASNPESPLEIVIDIFLTEEGDIKLIHSDNGPGFPENIIAFENYNVGIYLIKNIVEQNLKGVFRMKNFNGAVTEIQFPGGSRFDQFR